jgi:hypothetical protein
MDITNTLPIEIVNKIMFYTLQHPTSVMMKYEIDYFEYIEGRFSDMSFTEWYFDELYTFKCLNSSEWEDIIVDSDISDSDDD